MPVLFPPLIDPPAGTALRFPEGALTWTALRDAAAAVVERLAGRTRVAAWAEPTLDTAVGIIGALTAGITVVPLNPGIGRVELDHILGESRPEAILCSRRAAAPVPLPDALQSRARLTIDADERRADLPLPPASDPEAPALIVYTSGTTGLPKGAVLSARAIAANLDGLAHVWRWTARDVLVHALPLFHVHGLVLGTLGAVRVGSPLVHVGRFSPEGIAAAFDGRGTSELFSYPTPPGPLAPGTSGARGSRPSDARPSGGRPSDARPSGARPSGARPAEAVPRAATPSDTMPSDTTLHGVMPAGTMLFAVPTMYHRLAKAAEEDASIARALAKARILVSGSAPLAAQDRDRIAQLTGQRPIERYGLTETLIVCAMPPGDARTGVGPPVPGVDVRLVDDDGHVIPEGTADAFGEVEVRGPSLFSGYLDRPDATARALHDGWFRTGDTAIRDASNAYVIVGRTALDVIKTGGFKVGAGEVEDALRLHPAVAEVAVTGEADPDLGQRIVAWIVLQAGRSAAPADFEAHVAGALSSYKRPREIRFLDALPRNAMGKVEKRKLMPPAPPTPPAPAG